MFSIRVAKFADAKKIARIRVDALYVAYRRQISGVDLNARTVKRREAFWRGRFEQAKGSIFVIESDGEIIGFCDLIPSRDKDSDPKAIAEIAAIYVVSEHWQMGAGKVLFYHVLAKVRKQRYKAVTLWVLASNGDAMRFCESMGFARDGTLRSGTAPDGSSMHEIRYRLKLG